MGTGGIVANVSYSDYLTSAHQWDIFCYGLKKADSLGLKLWWYDEKGYPSGTAGGIVTRANPEHVALGLVCYVRTVEGPAEIECDLPVSCRRPVWVGAMIDPDSATADTVVDLSDQLDEWHTLRWSAPQGSRTIAYLAERVMYEGTHSAGNVCAFKHYVNVLEPDVIRAFLRVTHERTYRQVPQDLWRKFEAVFTDEPSFMVHYVPSAQAQFGDRTPIVDDAVFADRPAAVPWKRGLLEQFRDLKGYDLRPHLFALFFSDAETACYVRQDYYDLITQLYADAYYGQIQRWCRAHGIASSGHPLLEENLVEHLEYHGSLFAILRQMDLPGLDMLSSRPQEMLHGGSFLGNPFMAAKQVASVAHLTGRDRVHSESSDFEQRSRGETTTLVERRGQGDLLYVLGVNQITSYFRWDGFKEGDWRAYNDYMGRLALLLTGGQHVCDVAVLYPIRTMWAHYLPPLEPPASFRNRDVHRSAWVRRLDRAYPDLVRELLCHQVDLDIVDEEAIVTAQLRDGALCVAGEAYRAVVLPSVDALSLAAARALAAFCHQGGTLIAVEHLPGLAETAAHTEALRSLFAELFAERGPAVLLPADRVVARIRQVIGPDVALDTPNPDVLYTHRILEGRHLYFVINNAPSAIMLQPTLREPGPYTLYRPLTGLVAPAATPLSLALGECEGLFIVCEAT